MAAGSLSPFHPLTLREKAHALFYPRGSLSLALSLSFSFSHEFSVNFLELFVLFALVEASFFVHPTLSPLSLYFPSRVALRSHPRLPSSVRRRSDSLFSSRFRAFLSFAFQTNVSFRRCVDSPFSSIISSLYKKTVSLVLSLYLVSIISFIPALFTCFRLLSLQSVLFHPPPSKSLFDLPSLSLLLYLVSLSYTRILSWKISHPLATPQQETDAGPDSSTEFTRLGRKREGVGFDEG